MLFMYLTQETIIVSIKIINHFQLDRMLSIVQIFIYLTNYHKKIDYIEHLQTAVI